MAMLRACLRGATAPPPRSWQRLRRWAHQRLQVAEGVDLVVVDNVKVHGTRRHPRGALCAAMTTDGLRHSVQHEIAWLLEYPFPDPGRIPGMVVQLARYVKHLNDNAVYVRPGDVLDIAEADCQIGSFGSLGAEGAPGVRSIAFLPAPEHDEYWTGDHEFRVPPYPTVLATVLGEGERAFIGAAGGVAPVAAAQMNLFRYAPGLPYVPSARIVGARGAGAQDGNNSDNPTAGAAKNLGAVPVADGGDLVLNSDVDMFDISQETLPSPVRLNNATLVKKGSLLTLTIPTAVGEMLAPAFAEMLAERKDEAVTFLVDPTTKAEGALPLVAGDEEELIAVPSLDEPVILPFQPSSGKQILRRAAQGTGGGDVALSASGVVLKFYPDDAHLDGFDTVDQAGANLSDADHCDVTLAASNHLFHATLRHRSWLKLLDAFSKQKGMVCPAREPGGIHFEIRWTSGQDLPLYQQQAGNSAAAFQRLKERGVQTFSENLGDGADGVDAGASSSEGTAADSLETDGAENGNEDVLQIDDAVGERKRKLLLYTGKGDADAMTDAQKLKLRMAGGGSLLKQSLGELRAPMTAAQYDRYQNELNAHKSLAEGVKADMVARGQEQLEGNIIRIVWSYDESSPSAVKLLQDELDALAEYWARFKARLISIVMLFLEQRVAQLTLAPAVPAGAKPDLSPNVCLRVLPSAVTKEAGCVFGVLVKDSLMASEGVNGLVEILAEDEVLGSCPLSFGFDVFLNVARRGTYSAAQRRTAHWSDLEKHYRTLSEEAVSRLADLESQQQRLAAKEEELAAREAAMRADTDSMPPPAPEK